MIRHRRAAGAASIGLAAALVAASVATVSAATVIDFGSVSLGGVASREVDLPLDFALSQLPADTVLYSGGAAGLDLALGIVGLSAPVTAGALLTAIGEVNAAFHLSLDVPTGDFTIVDSDCESGTSACTAEIKFSPSETGPREASVAVDLTDVQLTGGGSFGSLVSLASPYLEASAEEYLGFGLIGRGIEGSGALTLEVDVEPAAVPCLIIDASLLDFGTLEFSTEEAVSSAARQVNAHSCSSGSEVIYAEGTDATGEGDPAAAWALSDAGGNPCAVGVDTYGVHLTGDTDAGVPAELELSTTSSSWLTLEAEQTALTTVDYRMPCTGSSGAGQTMTSQITFLATMP